MRHDLTVDCSADADLRCRGRRFRLANQMRNASLVQLVSWDIGNMDRDAALSQIDAAINAGLVVREDKGPGDAKGTEITEFLVSTIDRFTLPGSTYRQKLAQLREREKTSYSGFTVPALVGMLRSLRFEINAGYLDRISGLIRADTFTDFLDMAQHLLEEGYKDPAAVLAGSVLEQHLRALCATNDVEATFPDGKWKKADALNADLTREGVYTKMAQKNVTLLLGLRNEAAHGNYSAYEATNVRLMLEGISLFMMQHPA